MTDLTISDAGDALIINEETGGEAYYNKTEVHPDWPGGASGVTIGIGYDLGYSSQAVIAQDWGPYLSEDAVTALQSVAGIKGSPASSHAHELHWISVPWEAAIAVYRLRDMPKWIDETDRDLPNFADLHGDCRGALVSISFNRGPHWTSVAANDPSGRFREMRAIRLLMNSKQFDDIPAQILAMRRLWPVDGDLWKRRGHEAALFQQGLVAMKAQAIINPTPTQGE